MTRISPTGTPDGMPLATLPRHPRKTAPFGKVKRPGTLPKIAARSTLQEAPCFPWRFSPFPLPSFSTLPTLPRPCQRGAQSQLASLPRLLKPGKVGKVGECWQAEGGEGSGGLS